VIFPDEPVPLDAVRGIAALLKSYELGKIVLESKDGAQPVRLKFERDLAPMPQPKAPPTSATAPSLMAGEMVVEAVEVASSEAEALATSGIVEVVAPCVGVFRAPKKPLAVGDEVKEKQLVGAVESLRVPNEVYAPIGGRVASLSVVGGQGVEWGQTLLEIEPIL